MNCSKMIFTLALGLATPFCVMAQSSDIRAVELESSNISNDAQDANIEAVVTNVVTNNDQIQPSEAWHGQYPNYQDTEFGELLYNEASVPTRLEILSLLSKDTPSMIVFLHAISMGLGIEDVLEAAVRYEPDKGREFAHSAISMLPLLSESTGYKYATYELDDLDRDDESKPYSVKSVADRFFNDRAILIPYADWVEGQYHFVASAAELKQLAGIDGGLKWYQKDSSNPISDRPIFVSLYEANGAILVDNPGRIQDAIDRDGDDATVPVVVVFNRLNERPVDQLDYPLTLKGVQQAYSENTIMLTPAPEWERGEYHLKARLEEMDKIFDLPKEQDFEPEHWQKLMQQAQAFNSDSPAFLVVILSTGDEDIAIHQDRINGQQYAAISDPRAEQAYPYVATNDNPVNLKAMVSQGLVLNRPDLIAALMSSGVVEVPIAFYYIDSARLKPFYRNPRALRAIAIGAGTPPASFGGHGGFGPPPQDQPVASPPANN